MKNLGWFFKYRSWCLTHLVILDVILNHYFKLFLASNWLGDTD
jgi:hypothetical protein